MADTSAIPLFCLHFLGGSAQSWGDVAAAMSPAIRCVALDLPGFGDACDQPGADVTTMAEQVIRRIRAEAPHHWWIAGHSMGAKVALMVARRAEAGDQRLPGLAGIALVAGSPPAPEPVEETKRNEMMRWIDASHERRQQEARAYIRDNVGGSLEPAAEDHAVADVLRANPEAWRMWLTAGSREDCRAAVGALASPALVLSGTKDAALGNTVQEQLMLPHLRRYKHVSLEDAGHLLPIECPGRVAVLLRDAVTQASYI